MAKRLESRYLPGKRSRDWLKFKAHAEQEFVIAGYTRGKGRRSGGFGSLVLAVYGERADSSTSATSAPASTTRRSSGC